MFSMFKLKASHKNVTKYRCRKRPGSTVFRSQMLLGIVFAIRLLLKFLKLIFIVVFNCNFF